MGDEEQREVPAIDQRDRLTKEFQASGVDPSEFGFYDQPAFLAMEEHDKNYIQKYAEWIISRPMDADYDAHVRTIVPMGPTRDHDLERRRRPRLRAPARLSGQSLPGA